jgi:long-chain acyl-CoA synthetase
VERRLALHPDVHGSLVFGVPGEEAQRGEMMVACIVTRGSVTADALRSFLLRHGEAWEAPRDFWFVESLEANARGKLSRAEWRRRYEQSKGRAA